ncbi:NBR1-Ig-like domain-containing protein [Kutzneria sp. CA-103260]|uniref:NBR1-Ig-like domain-containing protein n=1 Tax=Kutzneria sp. CA-103260 TaxID=2802641 RepID=UPI001BEDE7A0|nr:NBR1-Ig-like domain-containing protein [Kutzneria sp. CA-103260]QUQ69107.1 Ig-like domain from next to BRCA1 gene [Kutzneria sp. CA-103260]
MTGPQNQARRGRKHIVPDVDAGPAARFARDLLELKELAGNPSYDRMRAELGAAASKSTLSAATRGRSLPSWETTWEFVRSLAGSSEDVRREWRFRWETANAELANPDAVVVELVDPGPEAVEATSRRKVRRRAALAIAAVVLLAAAAVLAPRLFRQLPTWGAANPYPLPGDASGFGGDGLSGDMTYPDGSQVLVGQTFTKVWRLKNIGTVPWHGRFLAIAGGTTVLCESPARVPVPDAEPGQMVAVSVPVTPRGTGTCHVLWKMVDAAGALVLPDHNGVFYDVRVIAPTH